MLDMEAANPDTYWDGVDDIDKAGEVIRDAIYGDGLGFGEVADRYGVDVDAVLWVCKARGIGFAATRDYEPPEDLEEDIGVLAKEHQKYNTHS